MGVFYSKVRNLYCFRQFKRSGGLLDFEVGSFPLYEMDSIFMKIVQLHFVSVWTE